MLPYFKNKHRLAIFTWYQNDVKNNYETKKWIWEVALGKSIKLVS